MASVYGFSTCCAPSGRRWLFFFNSLRIKISVRKTHQPQCLCVTTSFFFPRNVHTMNVNKEFDEVLHLMFSIQWLASSALNDTHTRRSLRQETSQSVLHESCMSAFALVFEYNEYLLSPFCSRFCCLHFIDCYISLFLLIFLIFWKHIILSS